MPQESLKKLYDAGSQYYDLGDFPAFMNRMQNANNRRRFYDAISQHYDLGDYATFDSRVSKHLQVSTPQLITPQSPVAKPGRIKSVEDLLAGLGRAEIVERDKHDIPPSQWLQELSNPWPESNDLAQKTERLLSMLPKAKSTVGKKFPPKSSEEKLTEIDRSLKGSMKRAASGIIQMFGNLPAGFESLNTIYQQNYYNELSRQTGIPKEDIQKAANEIIERRRKKALESAYAAEEFAKKYIGAKPGWPVNFETLERDPLGIGLRALIENVPQTAIFAGTSAVNPFAGSLLMYGVEAGETAKAFADLEKAGVKIDPVYRDFAIVGKAALNAALEKIGIDKILKKASPGTKGMLFKILSSVGTESGTEWIQEVNSVLAETGAKLSEQDGVTLKKAFDTAFNDLSANNQRLQEAAIGGAFGGAGTTVGVEILRKFFGDTPSVTKPAPPSTAHIQPGIRRATPESSIQPGIRRATPESSPGVKPPSPAPAAVSPAPEIPPEVAQKDAIAQKVYGKPFAELTLPQKNLVSKELAAGEARQVKKAVDDLFRPKTERKAKSEEPPSAAPSPETPVTPTTTTKQPESPTPTPRTQVPTAATAPEKTPTPLPAPTKRVSPPASSPKPVVESRFTPEVIAAMKSPAEVDNAVLERTLELEERGLPLEGDVVLDNLEKRQQQLYEDNARQLRERRSEIPPSAAPSPETPVTPTTTTEQPRLPTPTPRTQVPTAATAPEKTPTPLPAPTKRVSPPASSPKPVVESRFTPEVIAAMKSPAEVDNAVLERTLELEERGLPLEGDVVLDNLEKRQQQLYEDNARQLREQKAEKGEVEPQSAIPTPIRTSNVQQLPIADIATDVERFQNRATDFSEKTAATIAERYDPNLFDPIVVWKDDTTGKTYVLSGHSRLEGMKRRGEKYIPARYFQGTEAEAIRFARLEANRLGTAENLSEAIKAFREAKRQGLSKARLRDLFDGDIDLLNALLNLDPKGDFINILDQPASAEFPYIKRFARWVGELRGKYPDKLTDRHEQQIFDWLYKDEKKNVDTSKELFFRKVETQVDRLDFLPEQPLVMKRGGEARTGTRGRADTAQLEAQLDQLREQRRQARTPQEVQAIDKEIERLHKGITEIVRTQSDLFTAEPPPTVTVPPKPILPLPKAPTERPTTTSLVTLDEILLMDVENAYRRGELGDINTLTATKIQKRFGTGFNTAKRVLNQLRYNLAKTEQQPPTSTRQQPPTSADFDRAVATFNRVLAENDGKSLAEQQAAVRAALEDEGVHPIIIEELTEPRRTPRPFDKETGALHDLTTRKGRIKRAVEPPADLKPKVDAIADAGKAFADAEASLEQAKTDIIREIESRGGEVVVDTETGAFTIKLNPGRAKMSLADTIALSKLRQEAAEAGAYSLATVGRGFEIAVTVEEVAEAESLRGTFAEKAREFIRRNQAVKQAHEALRTAKKNAQSDLVDSWLAERAAGREPAAFKGVASDGTAVEVLTRRQSSAADPDLVVGGRDFPSLIARAKVEAKAESVMTGQVGEPFLEVRKTGKGKIAEAKNAGTFIYRESDVTPTEPSEFGANNTIVTREELEAAFESLARKVKLNTGIDPSTLPELLKIGTFYIEGGIREFNAWADKMIAVLTARIDAAFAERVRPHLRVIWDEIKKRRPGLFKAAKTKVTGQTGLFGETKETVTESNKLSVDIIATKPGGMLPDGRKLIAKNIVTRNGAQQGYVRDDTNREIVEYKDTNGTQRFAVIEKEQPVRPSVRKVEEPTEAKNVISTEQPVSSKSVGETPTGESESEQAKAVRETKTKWEVEGHPEKTGGERERVAGERQAESSEVDVSEETQSGGERSEQAGADIVGTGESGAGGNAGDVDLSERRATAKSRRGFSGISYEGDFRITDASGLGEGGKRQKFNDNIAAIRLLKQLEAEGRAATTAEQSILVKYVGWGGLAQEAFGYTSSSSNYEVQRGQLKELLTADERAAALASTPNAHYTSPPVVRAIYSALQKFGFKGGKVIEPGSGIGNFIGLLPDELYGRTRFTAIEMDEISGRILRKLYPSADLRLEPFQNTRIPDNFYDAMVGNVPFGNVSLFDPEINKKFHQKFSIHNFFIIKALEKLRPGGIMGFVTSRYTMDSQSKDFRKLVGQQADLIGAIRLPKETFSGNAHTEVVTDILFLKKRSKDEAAGGEKWIETKSIKGVDGGNIIVNEYYADHPEMMIGDASLEGSMYTDDEPTWSLKDASTVLPQEIAKRIEYLPKNIYSEERLSRADAVKKETERIYVPGPEDAKQGGFSVVDGKIGIVEGVHTTVDDATGKIKQIPQIRIITNLPKTQEEKILGMIAIRDAIREVYRTQLEDLAPEIQEKARENLNKKYDAFVRKHGFLNLRENRRAFESDPDAYIVLALENFNPDTKQATKTDIFSKAVVSPRKVITKVDTAADALAVSLSQKGLVDFDLMMSLTGKDEETLKEELVGLIYRVPGAGWVPADEYLSGNVRDKLENAREAAKIDPAFKVNVDALERVQPEPLDASQIIPRLGATWIPADIISKFADYISGGNNAWRVTHLNTLGQWDVVEKYKYSRLDSTLMRSKWGTSRINAIDLLRDALNLRIPTVYDSDEEGGRTLNEQETSLAQQKLQEIKDEFIDWAYKEPERRRTLVESYNRNFNSIRLRSFNGDHLTFDGMNKNIKLRKHQRDAVWRIISGGNTLIGHVVGAGKTFTMIAAGMEARRMGLFKKPMYVVRKHMIEQFRKEFLQLYPNANILVADEENFHGSVRKQFMARVATGDWDAVIVTHPSLKFIPMSKEAEASLLREQLDEMMSAEEALREELGDDARRDPSVKELVKAQMRIEEKLKALNDTKRDDAVTFEQIGVDMLFVDESQNFKNLFYVTKMNRVLGLGSQQGGPVTFDLYMKTRYISKLNGGERGVIFSTGTPISNSMSEMYLLMKYLQPQTLKESGLNHFDSWASTFGDVVTAIERTSTGKFEPRSRFAKFVNIPELAKMFRRFADIRTADDLPELKDLVPKLKGGEITPVIAQSSPELADYMEKLVERAELLRGRPEKGGDNHLNIATDARKAGLDMRLIDPNITPSTTPKVELAAENIYKLWRDTAEKKSTQIVFADMSAPAKDKFNIYDELKRLLVEKGIPAKEIAFIHDADTDTKKLELFNKVNRGDVRVIVGSTQKLGEGTNIQRKLIAIHHLDAPWRPSDVEQRNGRIFRQGNENKEVYEYRYATERSFDTNMWQKLEQKARFISQVMTSDLTVREAEDIVDAFASSAAEMKAITSGDPRIIELVGLENDIRKLEMLRSGHRKQIFELQDKVASFPALIESLQRRIDAYRKDMELAQSMMGKEEFELKLGKQTYKTRKDAGDAIIDAAKKRQRLVGEYLGFRIEIEPSESINVDPRINIRGNESYQSTISESNVGTIASLDNRIKTISSLLDAARQRQSSLEKDLQTAKSEVDKPFKFEGELQNKIARKFQILGELGNMGKHFEGGSSPYTIEPDMHEIISGNQAVFKDIKPYEPNYDKRPGATAKINQLAREAIESIGVNRRHGRVLLANAISAEAREKSTVSLIGKKVRTPDDVAALAQVYRDPRWETLRYIFVKDGKVVFVTGVSSRLPNSTAAFPYYTSSEGYSWLREIMAKTAADGYYLLHNHPSGDVTPSTPDARATEDISKNVDGFLGHVIINSNQYAVINDRKTYSQEDIKRAERFFELKPAGVVTAIYKRYFGEEKLLKPSIFSPILGTFIRTIEDVARIGQKYKAPDGWVTLISQAYTGVRGMMEVESSVIRNLKRAAAIIRRFARQTGASNIFLVSDQAFFDKYKKDLSLAVKEGFLHDAVSTRGYSVREELSEAGKLMGGGFRKEFGVFNRFGREVPEGRRFNIFRESTNLNLEYTTSRQSALLQSVADESSRAEITEADEVATKIEKCRR